jgi:hypothetical protein
LIDFDVSPDNIVVIAGVSTKNASQYVVTVKPFASTIPIFNTTLFAYKPVSVAISESSSLIAYFDSNSNINVFNIISKKFYPFKSNLTQLGVIDFIGEDKLLINYGSNFQIIDLFAKQFEKEI